MLKVLPIQSKEEQKEICSKCNTVFDPDLLAYSATVDGTLAGVCQFKLSDRGGLVYDLSPVDGAFDFEALFVLGRGALNFIDLCGVHNAIFLGEIKDDAHERLVKAVGFKKDLNDAFTVDLNGFFTDHCHDKK